MRKLVDELLKEAGIVAPGRTTKGFQCLASHELGFPRGLQSRTATTRTTLTVRPRAKGADPCTECGKHFVFGAKKKGKGKKNKKR
jgi:hypothetical protein